MTTGTEVSGGTNNTNGNVVGLADSENNNTGWDRDLERGVSDFSSRPDGNQDETARGGESQGETWARYPNPIKTTRGPKGMKTGLERTEGDRPTSRRSATRQHDDDENSSRSSSDDDEYADDYSYDSYEDDDDEDRGSDIPLEAWPRGIIKTVSVEVTEEVNEEYVAAMAAAEAARKANGGEGSSGSNNAAAANPFITIPPPAKLNGAPPIPPPRGHARGLSGKSTTSITGPNGSSNN
jgi:hypothetical protein